MLTDGGKAIAYVNRWREIDRYEAARELMTVIYQECVHQVEVMEEKFVRAARVDDD